MTLPVGQGYSTHVLAGDGAPIPFTFPVFPNANGAIDLHVEIRDGVTNLLIATPVYPVDYTVALAPAPGVGGSVTPLNLSLFAAGRIAFLVRKTKAHQEAKLSELEKLPAREIERMGDRIVAMVQDTQREVSRSIMLPVGETSRAIEMVAAERRGHLAVFADDGSLQASDGNLDAIAGILPLLPQIEALLGLIPGGVLTLGQLVLTGSAGRLRLIETDAPENAKEWQILTNGGVFTIWPFTDAGVGGPTAAVRILRSGTTVTEFEVNATTIDLNGKVDIGNGNLVLPKSAAPAQTEEGSLVFDTVNKLVTVGTGSDRHILVDRASLLNFTRDYHVQGTVNAVADTTAMEAAIAYALANPGTRIRPHGSFFINKNLRVEDMTVTAGAGTISATGTAVTGVGTAFIANLFASDNRVGCALKVGGVMRCVMSIASDGACTLKGGFPADFAGQPYEIVEIRLPRNLVIAGDGGFPGGTDGTKFYYLPTTVQQGMVLVGAQNCSVTGIDHIISNANVSNVFAIDAPPSPLFSAFKNVIADNSFRSLSPYAATDRLIKARNCAQTEWRRNWFGGGSSIHVFQLGDAADANYEGSGAAGNTLFEANHWYCDLERKNVLGLLMKRDNIGVVQPYTRAISYPSPSGFVRSNNVRLEGVFEIPVDQSLASRTDPYWVQGVNSEGFTVEDCQIGTPGFDVNGNGVASFSGNTYEPGDNADVADIWGVKLGPNATAHFGVEYTALIEAAGGKHVIDNRIYPVAQARTVPNYASARHQPIIPNTPIYIEGRATPRDGGQDWFHWEAYDEAARDALIAADPLEGIYLTHATDETGLLVRNFSGIDYMWDWFGGTPSVNATDYRHTQIQACVTAAGSIGGGRRTRGGVGDFYTNAPITLPAVSGVEMVGASKSNNFDAATRIIGAHLEGAIIRVYDDVQVVRDLLVDATSTRWTTGNPATGFGILVEPEDTPSGAVNQAVIEDVGVRRQPGTHIVLSGNTNQTVISRVRGRDSNMHEIHLSEGAVTGRTNKARPGQITIEDCRSYDAAGHVVLADETSLWGPYRLKIRNNESGSTRRDSTKLVSQHSYHLHGEDIHVEGCGLPGEIDGVASGSILVSGRNITLDGNRYIGTAQPVTVARLDATAGRETRDVRIRGALLSQDSTANPFCKVLGSAGDCTDIWIECGNNDIVTSWITAGVTRAYVRVPGSVTDTDSDYSVKSLAVAVSGASAKATQATRTDTGANYFTTYAGNRETRDSNVTGAGYDWKINGVQKVRLDAARLDHTGIFSCAGARVELTLNSSGAVTATQGFHSIDTEGDAASDDLVTINGGSEGDRLVIMAADSARTVVIKNGTGNIACGADISLDNVSDKAEFIKRGSSWDLLHFSNNGA